MSLCFLKGTDYNLQYCKVKEAVHAMNVHRFFVLTVILQEFIRLQSIIFSKMCTHLLSRIYATESTLDKTSVKSKNHGIKLISKLVQAKKIFQLRFRHFVFTLSYSFPGSLAVARDTRRVKSAGKSCWILTFLLFCNKLSNIWIFLFLRIPSALF